MLKTSTNFINLNSKKNLLIKPRYYCKVRNRVVVTGIGLVTPLGTGNTKNWNRLIKGEKYISNLNNNKSSYF